MTNEQVIATIVALILGNGATAWAVARWGIGRAIAYTHLERDVKELQTWRKEVQEPTNASVQKDLKGISIKIDRRTAPPPNV